MDPPQTSRPLFSGPASSSSSSGGGDAPPPSASPPGRSGHGAADSDAGPKGIADACAAAKDLQPDDGLLSRAKVALAPGQPLLWWTRNVQPRLPNTVPGRVTVCHHAADADATTTANAAAAKRSATTTSSVTVDRHRFVDRLPRIPVARFSAASHGDDLPRTPSVLTGCCDGWPALSWNATTLAERLPPDTRLNLDGGPGFARVSLRRGRCSPSDYDRYIAAPADVVGSAASDVAPLYVFDADVLANGAFASDGTRLADAYTVPGCFGHDAMGNLTGSRFRPLPPRWLLVGARRSGTPIHDHPTTVAWNALLTGCKLWCCFPPDTDEDVLLLNAHRVRRVDDGEGGAAAAKVVRPNRKPVSGSPMPLEFRPDDHLAHVFEHEYYDLSALQWFSLFGSGPASLHRKATVIVQRPGEVVFVPAGWWHVVLNAEDSTAISFSLTLRRDIPTILPPLHAQDEQFALFWLSKMREQDAAHLFEAAGACDKAADRTLATLFYERAALLGCADAQYNLGNLYESHSHLSADMFHSAVKWYESAAAQDHPHANTNLGILYATGRVAAPVAAEDTMSGSGSASGDSAPAGDLARNLKRAVPYLAKGARLGDKNAIRAIQVLAAAEAQGKGLLEPAGQAEGEGAAGGDRFTGVDCNVRANT